MGKFRISLGSASCTAHEKRCGYERNACDQALSYLATLKQLPVAQLQTFPEETTETINVGDQRLLRTVFRKDLSKNEILLVVQVFMPTWWFPTYFSSSGIGKIFVEGIVVRDGKVLDANDNELWTYR
jgi:hypothetical protein